MRIFAPRSFARSFQVNNIASNALSFHMRRNRRKSFWRLLLNTTSAIRPCALRNSLGAVAIQRSLPAEHDRQNWKIFPRSVTTGSICRKRNAKRSEPSHSTSLQKLLRMFAWNEDISIGGAIE